MYCPNCAREVDPGMKYCPECGYDLNASHQPNDGPSEAMFKNKKSDVLALILSMIIVGLGHMYINKVKKGVILLVAIFMVTLVGFSYLPIVIFCAPVIWFYAMYDAYTLTQEYNRYLLENQGQTPW